MDYILLLYIYSHMIKMRQTFYILITILQLRNICALDGLGTAVPVFYIDPGVSCQFTYQWWSFAVWIVWPHVNSLFWMTNCPESKWLVILFFRTPERSTQCHNALFCSSADEFQNNSGQALIRGFWSGCIVMFYLVPWGGGRRVGRPWGRLWTSSISFSLVAGFFCNWYWIGSVAIKGVVRVPGLPCMDIEIRLVHCFLSSEFSSGDYFYLRYSHLVYMYPTWLMWFSVHSRYTPFYRPTK